MKAIFTTIRHSGVRLFLTLLLSGFAQSVMAECVMSYDSDGELQNATVIGVDGNNGCTDISGQFGCSIKNPAVGSSCTYNDGTDTFKFTATIAAIDSQGLRWVISDNTTNIDTFQIKGASKGINNCITTFTYEATSGSGGDCTSFDTNGVCLNFSGFGGADFCSDLIEEVEPPPPPEPVVVEVIESCSGAGGKLDDTGIICPTYTSEENPELVGQEKPVVVCNFEKDKYAWGTVGSNVEGSTEQVCCQCGITGQTACIVSDDPDINAQECPPTQTFDPEQDVMIILHKDETDPCVTQVYGGKVYKNCW